MEHEIYALLDGALDCDVKWGAFEQDASLPRVSINTMSGTPIQTIDTKSLTQGRIMVDCYAVEYADVLTLSNTVQAALDRYQGAVVQGAFLETIRDLTDDDAGAVHRKSLTFSVTY